MFIQYLPILAVLTLGITDTINGLPKNPPYDVKELTSTQRIVGGTPAPDKFAPHMVALFIDSFFRTLICGGSIISKHYILTAAHCIDTVLTWNGDLSPSLRGSVGSNNLSSNDYIITFYDYKIHEKYNPWTIKYDVGVLYLTEKLKLSERVAIINLEFNVVGGGVKSFATGWGRIRNWSFEIPEVLQLLYVVTLSPWQCELGMKRAEIVWGPLPKLDHNVELCTFGFYGRGMCNGDSGSALVSVVTGLQTGLISWGIPCAHGNPDVAARISGFKDFLIPFIKNRDSSLN